MGLFDQLVAHVSGPPDEGVDDTQRDLVPLVEIAALVAIDLPGHALVKPAVGCVGETQGLADPAVVLAGAAQSHEFGRDCVEVM